MDRKAWFVVTLCVIAIGAQLWWAGTHTPPPQPQQSSQQQASAPTAGANSTPTPGAPATPTPAPAPGTTPAPAPTVTAAPAAMPEQKVELKNDKASYVFTTKGGGLLVAELLDSHDHVKLNEHGKAAMGSLSSTRLGADLDYKIVEQTASSVTFEAETSDHLLIRKSYSFTEGNGSSPHLLNFKLSFINKSNARVSRSEQYLYTGAAASLRPDEILHPAFCWNDAGDANNKETGNFKAGWFGWGAPVVDFTQTTDRLRWAGVMSRFYAQLISTKEDMPAKLWGEPFVIDHSEDEFKTLAAAKDDKAMHGEIILPSVDLDNGEKKDFEMRIYMGPKIFRDLKNIDSADPDRQLRYVMFYGIVSWVSRFLVWVLRGFHDVVNNWGVAIIFLTLFVRSLLWPVQARANSAMKRMALVSPKLKELQEKYKDDPQRVNAEMIKLYREYGVNPVGGCLPMLIQIPVFWGFYSVLRYAAELRGESFLWVPDLSMPDTIYTLPFALPIFGHLPINPLPLVMGLSSFLQMRLTPQPPNADKTQAAMLRFMPLIFLMFCYNFAAALALYWTTQNLFSIFQAQVQRRYGKEVTLEKKTVVERPRPSMGNFGRPDAKEKKKPSLPRLGGGSSRSTRKDP